METLTVERAIWINASREKVWQAITTQEGMKHWWGADEWEFNSLEIGAEIKFGDPDDFMVAYVDAVDAPHLFRIKWPPQEQYHSIPIYTTYTL